MHKAGVTPTGSDPEVLFWGVTFHILNNDWFFCFKLDSKREQSSGLLNSPVTLPFPRKVPYHRTAQSCQVSSNPTKMKSHRDFRRWTQAGVCFQVSVGTKESKGWFSTSSDSSCFCGSEMCLRYPVTALMQTSSLIKELPYKIQLQRQAQKYSKSKGFLQIVGDYASCKQGRIISIHKQKTLSPVQCEKRFEL